ncbi:hypothetical protein SCBWM1_gp50 [Synechococcus phage S-CBWM1]|uniref:Uncharacterized protein n=1 Tax=Synechococcus phage S-CBWM1 TaxID=2053653 RepID=A0A3G1L3H0_9CAUD|nr:hypothetical protein HOU61_gp147 [Synechococcus phage S-CBWM1]ATW62734.1 hypothetical protein SCBWM1_gp50 [Synechococcus phage S-CBWM1]
MSNSEVIFQYSIKESPVRNLVPFSVPSAALFDSTLAGEVIGKAAYIYFYGNEGWKCELGWPLTFEVFSRGGKFLFSRIVFILNGDNPPEFEVV